jgi:hypothetical protein
MISAFSVNESEYGKTRPVTTTLYDLIEAVNEEVPPGQDWPVTRIVSHLINPSRKRRRP